MAVRPTRQELREKARDGNLEATVELLERWQHPDLKALLCDVCSLEVPLTERVFDVCADAWAMAQEHRELAMTR